MAKKRSKKRWTARRGKRAFCRTIKANDCTVKISGRRYKAKGKACPTGKVVVCPHPRGRKTIYKISRPGKASISLHKMARRRRRR